MFESIQKGLSEAFRSLRGTSKFSEANMREGLQAVRRALLEADVHVKVADAFIDRVQKTAMGREVLKSLRPADQIVEVVYHELVSMMGPVDPTIRLAPGRPTVLMMCGLQGSGKTTTCAKLAKLLVSQGQHPLLAAADLQRPAAVEQLKVLGAQLNIPVYAETNSDPVRVCQNAVKEAKATNRNIVILDTAGRLHIDHELMKELQTIDKKVNPDQCYLVLDSLTGQDAVHSAKAFNEALELDAVLLTKLDGDARGGAALSIKEVTGVPIKFAGMGEKIDDLEIFHPERMAHRILGMGDVLTLIEKTRQVITEEQAREQQEKLEKGKFDLNDFRDALRSMASMGSMAKMLEMLPGGIGQMMPADVDLDVEYRRVVAMLDSMTPEERSNPDIVDISRRRRIAKGCGVEHHEINKLIKMFEDMRPMMKSFAGKGIMDRMKSLAQMGKAGLFGNNGMGMLKQKARSKRNELTDKDRAKLRKQERQRKKKNRKK